MKRSPRVIRVFISSPGDVLKEREIAQKILDKLEYDPQFVEKISIRIIAWDKPNAGAAMLAHMTPQEAIDAGLPMPSECDIVAVIFWSRMGTPLTYNNQDYLSGTHYEYIDAINAAKKTGKPFVILYRRTEKVVFDRSDPNFAEKSAQYQKVQDFFQGFTDSQGRLTAAYNTYATLNDFEREFEYHVRGLITKLLEEPAPLIITPKMALISLILSLVFLLALIFSPQFNYERLRWLARTSVQLSYLEPLDLSVEQVEVTVARYRWCVEAAVCDAPVEEKDGEKNPYYVSHSDSFPVVGINAVEAFKFCHWIQRRLPTADEWAAFATMNHQMRYPWGNEPPNPTRANLYYEAQESRSFLEAVGQYPAGSYENIHDLIGNASEWTATIDESGDDRRDKQIWISLDDLPAALYVVGGSYRITPEALEHLETRITMTNAASIRLQIGFRCVE